jgi:precorrin-3B C17-methyltransferase
MSGTTGWIVVAGLGPGAEAMVTPEVSAALAEATDVVGYIPYVARMAPRPGLVLHAVRQPGGAGPRPRTRWKWRQPGGGWWSSPRAIRGSSPWPRRCSRRWRGREDWQALDIRVLPGITAMLAARRGLARRWGMTSARSTCRTT